MQVLLALCAGVFGALSSVFGKLAAASHAKLAITSYGASIFLMAVYICGAIGSNLGMWYCFTITLSDSKSASLASVLNLSGNFLATVRKGIFPLRLLGFCESSDIWRPTIIELVSWGLSNYYRDNFDWGKFWRWQVGKY